MQRYSLHYGRKAEHSHNRENSLYNTAITQGNLLDHYPGQGMQNWKNNIIKTPYFGQYLENWNTRELIGLNSDSMNEDAKISFCAANVIWITLCMTTHYSTFNSLWPSDTIWQQRSGSTLAQVMAEPVLTDHRWSLVTFILGQFHKRCLNHQQLKSVWKLHV